VSTEITILDGGMGDELAKRGTGSWVGLWSAQALVDAPTSVVEVHKDFIKSGARIITTNSYSTIPSYLGKVGMEDRFVELTALAGQLARQAADESGEDVRVAGSLPPLSESYRADLSPSEEDARPIYEAMATALEPHVDLYLCETMSKAREARTAAKAALRAAEKRQLPVNVSWTLKEEPGKGLRSGETIVEALSLLSDLDIAAFFFNCTHPLAIEAALQEIRPLTHKPLGAYPNNMNEVPEGWTLDTGNIGARQNWQPEIFAKAAMRLVEAGATTVGGCCGIGPEWIAAFKAELDG